MSLSALTSDLNEFEPVNPLDGLTSTREDEKERIYAAKNGTLPMGLETGYKLFDEHFRYKPESLVIINGHNNVGKSFLIWYLMVIASIKHNWKWILFCGENKSADIRRQIVEFIGGSLAKYMDDDKFDSYLDWAYEFFEIIELSDDDQIETAELIMEITEKIVKTKGKFNGLLIDPYNALQMDMQKLDRRLSTHDYHYLVATKFRKFCKKHNMTIWVSMHAVSESLRRTDKDGYPLPPGSADTEGGGKFSNRADEFMTFHRYVQDSTRSKTTEIHVRKIKDTYTGGSATDLNSPITLEWSKDTNGFNGFYDTFGKCVFSNGFKDDSVKVEKFPEVKNSEINFEEEVEKAYDKAPF